MGCDFFIKSFNGHPNATYMAVFPIPKRRRHSAHSSNFDTLREPAKLHPRMPNSGIKSPPPSSSTHHLLCTLSVTTATRVILTFFCPSFCFPSSIEPNKLLWEIIRVYGMNQVHIVPVPQQAHPSQLSQPFEGQSPSRMMRTHCHNYRIGQDIFQR